MTRLNLLEIFIDASDEFYLPEFVLSEGKIAIDNLDELYQRLMAINFRVKRSLFDAIFED